MIQYVERNGVGYYYSTLLKSKNAFSTRKGGVSAIPALSALNLAFGRGDDHDTVLENLRRFAKAVEVDPESVISLPQVHGADVLIVTDADAGRGYTKDAIGTGDGYVSAKGGVTLGVKSADCVPVLMEARDQAGRVLAVAAVHAGWKGTAGGIAPNAVKALRALCGQAEIFAAIGPCIGQCCFEVGQDCVDVFAQNWGAELVDQCFVKAGHAKYYGDLTLCNRILLEQQGIFADHIDTADICTCCNPGQFFSHRYAAKHTNGNRGTMLSVICKENDKKKTHVEGIE